VKPSQDIDLLEAQIVAEESSDDSEFKVGDEDEDANRRDSDNTSSSSSSSSDEDEDDEADENELAALRKEMTTEELLAEAQARSNDKSQSKAHVKVCGCCLGQASSDANEIVECDSCGISVHEGCYGVPQTDASQADAASEVSAASTEPWFCEPCRAGLQEAPPCDLCPSRGGIYKQTDVGRWVHLVCALYVPHVAFGDPEHMTHVTVFEMNYTSFGRRMCALCSEPRLSRTGVCIQCDAGMCKVFFHAYCGQRQGLLAEPSFDSHQESLVADLYLGHCKVIKIISSPNIHT
jgi:hypothetical protein